jgi:hypothetical protein
MNTHHVARALRFCSQLTPRQLLDYFCNLSESPQLASPIEIKEPEFLRQYNTAVQQQLWLPLPLSLLLEPFIPRAKNTHPLPLLAAAEPTLDTCIKVYMRM